MQTLSVGWVYLNFSRYRNREGRGLSHRFEIQDIVFGELDWSVLVPFIHLGEGRIKNAERLYIYICI
jgi:hypothetical protein